MSIVAVWCWQPRGVYEPYAGGHVDIEVCGHLYGLTRKRGAACLDPTETREFRRVYPGHVWAICPADFAQQIELVTSSRSKTPTALNLGSPDVVVFSKPMTADAAHAIEEFVIRQVAQPPNYSTVSVDSTMNCVTFVAWVLGQAGILPADFRLNTREYMPTLFQTALEELHTDGHLPFREERALQSGAWVLKKPSSATS